MKTITVHQPWASLIAVGAKRIETRSWLLTDVVQLPEPIPARGRQGLWEWDAPPDVETLLR